MIEITYQSSPKMEPLSSTEELVAPGCTNPMFPPSQAIRDLS